MSLAREARTDLTSQRQRVAEGHERATAALERSLAAADAAACANAYIRRFDAAARAAAAAADAAQAAGAPVPLLAGLAVSVKDLFDVAGAPTTGGSAVLADAAPAAADAPAVARLRAAGAAITGHTNLSEFAFSGVGINPHHGTPANAGTAALDAAARVPGGSTSGGATTVASGAAWAALGSDTGGSIRIPAALQGLVGFKNTQALVPRDGSLPLSTTLDTACAITRSVRDAALLHGVLAGRAIVLREPAVRGLRLGVPRTLMLDGLEPAVAEAFEAALRLLRDAGAQVDELSAAPLADLATINAQGGFAAAESWHAHRTWHEAHAERYDPRVALRIRRGAAMSADDYLELLDVRRDWIARMAEVLRGYDAFVSPTVPMVAPPLAPLIADDEAFFATNGRLLRNPSSVNFLDGCALSLPCQRSGDWPVGLMVWHGAWADEQVLGVGAAIERLLHGAGRG